MEGMSPTKGASLRRSYGWSSPLVGFDGPGVAWRVIHLYVSRDGAAGGASRTTVVVPSLEESSPTSPTILLRLLEWLGALGDGHGEVMGSPSTSLEAGLVRPLRAARALALRFRFVSHWGSVRSATGGWDGGSDGAFVPSLPVAWGSDAASVPLGASCLGEAALA